MVKKKGGATVQQINTAYAAIQNAAKSLVTLLALDQAQFPDRQNAIEQRAGTIASSLLLMRAYAAELDSERYLLQLDLEALETQREALQHAIGEARWSELYFTSNRINAAATEGGASRSGCIQEAAVYRKFMGGGLVGL